MWPKPRLLPSFLILRLLLGLSRGFSWERGGLRQVPLSPGMELAPLRCPRPGLSAGFPRWDGMRGILSRFSPILTNSSFSRAQNGAGSHGRVLAPLPKSPFPKKPHDLHPRGLFFLSAAPAAPGPRGNGAFPSFFGKIHPAEPSRGKSTSQGQIRRREFKSGTKKRLEWVRRGGMGGTQDFGGCSSFGPFPWEKEFNSIPKSPLGVKCGWDFSWGHRGGEELLRQCQNS